MNEFLNFFKRIHVEMDIFPGIEFGVRFLTGNELNEAAAGDETPPASFGVLLGVLFVNVLLVWEKKETA